MTWEEILPDPDDPCLGEYRAIHDFILDVIQNAGPEGRDSKFDLTPDDVDHIGAMLEEFSSHAQCILQKLRELQVKESTPTP